MTKGAYLVSISEPVRMQCACCTKTNSTVDWLYSCLFHEKHQITHRDRTDNKYV